MYRYLLILLAACGIAFLIYGSVSARAEDPADAVLDSAERFFLSLKDRNFSLTWRLLSEKSRETIISDVDKASRKIGGAATAEEIRNDFETSGVISANYWDAFLNTFDPDMILEESRWEIGFIKNNKAEILITHRKSREPAVLSVSMEDNIWKVGLVETFWTRKSLYK
jgi:hypothetical protein